METGSSPNSRRKDESSGRCARSAARPRRLRGIGQARRCPLMSDFYRFCADFMRNAKTKRYDRGFCQGVYFRQWPSCPEDNAVMARCLPEGRSQTIVGDLSPSLLLRASAHDRQRSQLKQARSFHTAIRVVRFSIGHQRSHSTSYGNAGSFPTARLKRTSFFELSASRVGSSAFNPQQPQISDSITP